jgi:hypothetical protein
LNVSAWLDAVKPATAAAAKSVLLALISKNPPLDKPENNLQYAAENFEQIVKVDEFLLGFDNKKPLAFAKGFLSYGSET